MSKEPLYKGVFWVKRPENIKSSSVCLKALCAIQGGFIDKSSINNDTLSKNENNFNHKKVWQTLDKGITEKQTLQLLSARKG